MTFVCVRESDHVFSLPRQRHPLRLLLLIVLITSIIERGARRDCLSYRRHLRNLLCVIPLLVLRIYSPMYVDYTSNYNTYKQFHESYKKLIYQLSSVGALTGSVMVENKQCSNEHQLHRASFQAYFASGRSRSVPTSEFPRRALITRSGEGGTERRVPA